MPTISRRAQGMPASPIRRLVPLADEAKKRGVRVLHLNIGQPDLPSPPQAMEALRHVNLNKFEYSPSDGLLSLRRKLLDYYRANGIDASLEDIIVTSGGSEAVMFAFQTCLDPGDEIIMTEPGYANYMAFADEAGAKITTIPSRIEDGFALPDINDFERLINAHTKAILICNPNNPTGYLYSREELMKIRDLVKKHDLFLFSDEVYREFCYTDQPCISAFQLPGIEDQVVLIDSVSKRYNECGIRIGALVTKNEEVRRNVMKFCQARLSPPLLGQIIAEASIECGEEYLRHTKDEYIRRRDILIGGLNEIPGVYAPMPMGAFYAVVKLPVGDAEEFCKWCLREFSYDGTTVFMAPAEGFYMTPGMGRNEVRMAYVLEADDLRLALRVLRRALEVYPGRK